MSSSILHQCPFCGHISDISLSLAAFIENPHCAQCGLSVSESNSKIQDELSALFDRQMSMEQPQHATQPINPPASIPTSSQQQPITYSITQHYHHSSHVAILPPVPSTPSPTDPNEALLTLLQNHGIDPSTLTPSQLDLVRHADAEQQQRLLQTWQVYAAHGQPAPSQDTDMDDSMHDDKGADAEPYMVSGYETSASALPREPSTGEPYAASTDPVYKSQQWWEVAPGSTESQYGLFEERNRFSRLHGCAGVRVPQWLCPN
ncbi:hypothetical protein F1880_005406 [Penicillium rolfsii]|nr:hypothetical protein F1880_005406 [Penicillium rolfsii]